MAILTERDDRNSNKQKYDKWAKYAGPHSKLGKFYRQKSGELHEAIITEFKQNWPIKHFYDETAQRQIQSLEIPDYQRIPLEIVRMIYEFVTQEGVQLRDIPPVALLQYDHAYDDTIVFEEVRHKAEFAVRVGKLLEAYCAKRTITPEMVNQLKQLFDLGLTYGEISDLSGLNGVIIYCCDYYHTKMSEAELAERLSQLTGNMDDEKYIEIMTMPYEDLKLLIADRKVS